MAKKIARRILNVLRGQPDAKANFVKQSYSQCGEDLILEHIFGMMEIPQPTFIDIGAHHPRYLNNTYLMYTKGSRGVSVEPDPALFGEFLKHRPEDRNINVGVGLEKGEADFYIMTEPTLNTFIREEAENATKVHAAYTIKEVKRLKIVPLDEIVDQHLAGKYPDFLTIDIEGLDEPILRALKYGANSPKVMCVETLSFSPKGQAKKKNDLIDFLKAQGYFVYAETYINTIFEKESVWNS